MSSESRHDTETTETTEPDNINVGLIATITIVGALLVVSIAAALTALVRTENARYSDEVGAYANLGEVGRLKQTQRDKLAEDPKWADRAKGLASIPIDRAMHLFVADLQRNPNLATPYKPDEDAGAEKTEPTGSAEAPPGSATAEPTGQTGSIAGEKGPAPEKAVGATEEAAAKTAETGEKRGQAKGASPTTNEPAEPAPGAATPGGTPPATARAPAPTTPAAPTAPAGEAAPPQ